MGRGTDGNRMRHGARLPFATLAVCTTFAAANVAGQEPAPPPTAPLRDGAALTIEAEFVTERIGLDHREVVLDGGFRITYGDVEIYGERGVVRLDRDEAQDLIGGGTSGSGLPRRGAPSAPARRALSDEVLRERLQSFLRAAGATPRPTGGARQTVVLRLARSLYLEGGVAIVRGGVEVARAERILMSTHDDRVVLEDALLRLVDAKDPAKMLVVRGPKLVRQGPRTVGRDVSVTTCDAGVPHVEVRSELVEIVERGGDFEVKSSSSTIAVAGVTLFPLPNTSFYTSEQSQIPLRGASGGYSDREGVRFSLEFGRSMNRTGGAIHEWLTGRPASEFRGNWRAGLGWIEKRGYPTELGFDYRADGVYRGSIESLYLDDRGTDIREITRNIDGSAIDRSDRFVVRTENRLHLSSRTTLDLSVFDASDAAIYSEFFRREYRETEAPETSAHLRHADENRILTVTGRFNATDFSYRDDLSLAPAFVEERPVATFDWIAQPLFDLPLDTPLLFTASTNIGRLERRFDPRVPAADVVDDATTRLDQRAELAAPFRFGALRVRPYLAGRVTHYEDSIRRSAETRLAYEAGIAASTRMERTFEWLDGIGQRQAMRHVIHPVVTWFHRFGVSDPPTEFFQFDEIDALDDRSEVRFEVLQRLQRVSGAKGTSTPVDQVFLDLAQPLRPHTRRDNGGELLAPFEYEMLVRAPEWIPVPELKLLLEGEHDWNERRLRTFNTGARFRALDVAWFTDYRTDHTTRGAISYGGTTQLLHRWQLGAGSQYDLEREENLYYGAELIRQDHDFRLVFALSYDIIGDDLSFTINFEPTLRGFLGADERRYRSGRRYRGTDDLTEW